MSDSVATKVKNKNIVDASPVTGLRGLLMLNIAVGHMALVTGINHISYRMDFGSGAGVAGFMAISGFMMAVS